MKKVCVITTAHPAGDNRIFHREVKSLSKMYKVIYITTSGDLKNLGTIELRYIEGWSNHFQRFMGNFKAFMVAQKSKADIFHFHDPEFVPFGIILKILKKKPVIYDIHEDYPAAVMGREWIPRYLRKMISVFVVIGEKLTLRHLTQLIAASNSIFKRYSKINKKITLIDNFPSDEIINKFFKTEKSKNIVCLGDLNEIRGAKILIPAVIDFIRDRQIDFYLIGDIRPESLKNDLLGGLDNETMSKIKITGHKDYEEAIRITSKMGVGVLSYMNIPNHLNTSPNKLYEYMGLGLAIIFTDLPNYKSYLQDEMVGISYKDNSCEDLLRALRDIYDGDIPLSKMQENGRKLFLEKYNWRVEEKKLLELYKYILGDSR